MSAGAARDQPNSDGSTPLWAAAWEGHVEVVLALLAGQEHHPQQVLAGMELHQQFLVLA